VSARGEIFFESEGNDYSVARRASATKWIIYGDDLGVGAKRPRVGIVRREPGSGWWDIYRGSRVFGRARGRDAARPAGAHNVSDQVSLRIRGLLRIAWAKTFKAPSL